MALQQKDIITKALAILQRDGIEGVTFRKLAGELNIQAMSLYYHVKNKRKLFDAMAEAILQTEFSKLKARVGNEAWQAWLTETMQKLRRAMLSHTDGARVVAGAHLYPAVTLGKIADISMQSLHEAGFSLLDARQLVMTTMHYTYGHVIEEQSSPTVEELEHIDLGMLRKRYPTTVAAIEAAGKAHRNNDDDFNDGLKLMIRP